MSMENNNKITRQLRDLIVGHPDLPIFYDVDTEVVFDDSYSSWLGKGYHAVIEEIWQGKEKFWTRSEILGEEEEFLEIEVPELIEK